MTLPLEAIYSQSQGMWHQRRDNMRKHKYFEVFGIVYETTQFSATDAFDMVDYLSIVTPKEMLRHTNVIKYDKSVVPLIDDETINKEVKDTIGRVAPNLVLRAVMEVVSEYNFGFLKDWKGVKIPGRFIANSTNVESSYVEPIIANIVTNGLATLKELEEYYSLYDAFSLFDAMLVKTVNEAYAHEAAEAEAKSRRG